MKKRYLLFIGVLLAVCVDGGFALANPDQQQSKPARETLSDFMDRVQKDVGILKSDFDGFFNDEFFKNTPDPFKEIESIHNKMRSMMLNHTMNSFDDSWNSWYNGRFSGAEMSVQTEDNKDSVVMRIKVNGLQKNNLDINIDKDRVKIECDVKDTREEQDAKGNKISSYLSEQHIVRLLSLPQGVDSSKAVTKQGKDEIVITFPKPKK